MNLLDKVEDLPLEDLYPETEAGDIELQEIVKSNKKVSENDKSSSTSKKTKNLDRFSYQDEDTTGLTLLVEGKDSKKEKK